MIGPTPWGGQGSDSIEPSLAAAFDRVQRELGATKSALPGRPKPTLLNPLFRLAGWMA